MSRVILNAFIAIVWLMNACFAAGSATWEICEKRDFTFDAGLLTVVSILGVLLFGCFASRAEKAYKRHMKDKVWTK